MFPLLSYSTLLVELIILAEGVESFWLIPLFESESGASVWAFFCSISFIIILTSFSEISELFAHVLELS